MTAEKDTSLWVPGRRVRVIQTPDLAAKYGVLYGTVVSDLGSSENPLVAVQLDDRGGLHRDVCHDCHGETAPKRGLYFSKEELEVLPYVVLPRGTRVRVTLEEDNRPVSFEDKFLDGAVGTVRGWCWSHPKNQPTAAMYAIEFDEVIGYGLHDCSYIIPEARGWWVGASEVTLLKPMSRLSEDIKLLWQGAL